MALDNAQFISELSITDPPGTDAVAEGDDHIRTTKRATQQSFPNVDAAVPQTAAQMGQMAIKNEVNTFTQTNIFTARNDFQNIRFDAAVGTTRGFQYFLDGLQNWAVSNNFNVPALQFQRHDPATGIFVDTPISIDNTTGEVTAGSGVFNVQAKPTGGGQSDIRYIDQVAVQRWVLRTESDALGNDFVFQRRDATGVLVSTPIRFDAVDGRILASSGTEALPQYSFQSALTSGMYRDGANALGFATDGVRRFGLDTQNAIWTVNHRMQDGSAAFPSYTFSNQTDLGFYHEPASNVIACATGGAQRWRLSQSSMTVNSDVILGSNGVVGGPGYAFRGDTNTGMYRESADVLAFAAGGVRRLRVKGFTVSMDLPPTSAGLASGDLFVSSGFVAIVP